MRNLDLNLLPQLQVLLELRNVSRAAERLQLSQPATSAAMAKLRRHFNDELLTRTGRTYELTPFAQALLPLVTEAVAHAQRATRIRSGFDPRTSEREFVIAASDYAASLVVGPLRRILVEEAPGVAVDIVPNSGFKGEMSELSRTDLLMGPTGYRMQGASRELFRDSFVAVVDDAHPLLDQDSVTLEDLARLPHAVGFFGEQILTPADRLFADRNLKRPVAAVVAGFLALPLLIEGTDLVAMMPAMLAARSQRGARLSALRMSPGHEVALVEALYWHPTQTDDPAHSWLRSVVQRACTALNDQIPLTPHRLTIGIADTS